MKRNAAFIAVALIAVFLAGCATVGHKFPSERVPELEIGKTTSEEVRSMFGEPWRTGIEDGLPTWTYGRYKYRLIGDDSTTDLVIRFDANNVVKSYTYNTTESDR